MTLFCRAEERSISLLSSLLIFSFVRMTNL
jgi:hypothetical protein